MINYTSLAAVFNRTSKQSIRGPEQNGKILLNYFINFKLNFIELRMRRTIKDLPVFLAGKYGCINSVINGYLKNQRDLKRCKQKKTSHNMNCQYYRCLYLHCRKK